MRELKFRAWDKIAGCWSDDPNSSLAKITLGLDGSVIIDDDCATYRPEDYIIEQFTGLLDKNGKMIFEGDVIKSIDIDEYCDERVETEKIEAVGSLNKYIETLSWIPKYGEIIGTIHDAEYKELAK